MKRKISLLIPEGDIRVRVAELAEQISRDYKGKNLLMVGILKGAVIFLSDLVRCLSIPVCIDFMAVSSYGAATESSGVVRILKDLDESLEGKHVIIVEDIVDTGLTLRYLWDNLQARNPESLAVCVLLDKPSRRKVEVPLHYLGFEIPDEFVVGYGLDCDEQFRNLPHVAAIQDALNGKDAE